MDMKKNLLLISTIAIFLASISLVIAAGSSTGNAQRPPSWSEARQANLCNTDSDCIIKNVDSCCGNSNWCMHVNDIINPKPSSCAGLSCPAYIAPDDNSCVCNSNKLCRPSSTSTTTTCEDIDTPRERIKCRFQNKAVARAESSAVTEEACRGQARAEECKQLYVISKSCYDINSATAKKRCFLEKAGININASGTFRAAPNDSKRNYVILLLYELQERIENMEERGALSTDKATNLITQIVEIKKLILEGKPRSEIVPKIQQFKTDYREIVGTA